MNSAIDSILARCPLRANTSVELIIRTPSAFFAINCPSSFRSAPSFEPLKGTGFSGSASAVSSWNFSCDISIHSTRMRSCFSLAGAGGTASNGLGGTAAMIPPTAFVIGALFRSCASAGSESANGSKRKEQARQGVFMPGIMENLSKSGKPNTRTTARSPAPHGFAT